MLCKTCSNHKTSWIVLIMNLWKTNNNFFFVDILSHCHLKTTKITFNKSSLCTNIHCRQAIFTLDSGWLGTVACALWRSRFCVGSFSFSLISVMSGQKKNSFCVSTEIKISPQKLRFTEATQIRVQTPLVATASFPNKVKLNVQSFLFAIST